jgi:hypothetical protein
VNNLRSDSRDLDAIFMYVEEAVFDWITPNRRQISVREGVESRDFFGRNWGNFPAHDLLMPATRAKGVRSGRTRAELH